MMKTKTFLASFAVFGLAVAQPAAAATRSYDSLPVNGVTAPAAAERVGSITAEAEDVRGARGMWVILVGLALAIAIVLAATGNKSAG